MVDNVRSVLDFHPDKTNGKDKEYQQTGPMNSPRSLEACLRKGYDPEELRPCHPKTFKKSGLSAEMVELQHGHFEKRRQEKVKIVTDERQRIIEFLNNLQQAGGLTLPGVAASKRNIKDNMLGQSPVPDGEVDARSFELKSKMMDLEIRRIEAVKKRQQRELARMVESEQKLAELQKKILHAEEDEARRKREHEKQVAEFRAVAMEKKRDREIEKKKKEEAELQARRVIAEREQEREKKIGEEEKVKMRALSLDAMQRDRERTAKMEEHGRKSQIALQKQEEMAEKNLLDLKLREERLRVQLEAKKAAKKQEIQEQRAKAELRIATALERNRKAQEDKKRMFDQRQEEAAHRAMEKAIELQEQMTEQVAERDQKLAQRKDRLGAAVQARVDRRQATIDNRTKREQYYDIVSAEREQKLSLKKLDSELAKGDRIQNVARIRRIDDFLRLQTLQKVQEDDQRSAMIKTEKGFLSEQRKQTAHDAFLRKQRVRESMEQMRVTNKFVSLDHILEGNDKKRRKKKTLSRTESAPTPRTGAASA